MRRGGGKEGGRGTGRQGNRQEVPGGAESPVWWALRCGSGRVQGEVCMGRRAQAIKAHSCKWEFILLGQAP